MWTDFLLRLMERAITYCFLLGAVVMNLTTHCLHKLSFSAMGGGSSFAARMVDLFLISTSSFSILLIFFSSLMLLSWPFSPADHLSVFQEISSGYTFYKVPPLLTNLYWKENIADISHSLQKQSRVFGLFSKDPLLHTKQDLAVNKTHWFTIQHLSFFLYNVILVNPP